MSALPTLDLSDPAVLTDPYGAYAEIRERSPVAMLTAPGMPPMWAVTRHAEGRAMLADERFEILSHSYQRPDVPEHCRRYMRTMSETNGAEHRRLRRLVAPPFTPRNTESFRPHLATIVDALVDALPAGRPFDLLADFARPLPTEAISELVGVPAADRPRWRAWGAAVVAGHGPEFTAAIPGILAAAEALVAARRAEAADDLISDLVRAQDEGNRLSDDDLVTFVWQLLLAGQTPTNLIANAVQTLFTHPEQLALLRSKPELMPGAVEELTRFAGPQLLTVPRYSAVDAEIGGVTVPAGSPVTVALASVNRDPRVFTDPDILDVTRPVGRDGHMGYAHGEHFCLGAPLARAQTELALSALWRRFPDLAPAGDVSFLPDPGTWRLASLPVVG
ncbi:cytochrome P450 family protein [Phytomonospora endophytica]|uniref:Cytochrome P450 n=1 Tax=Phytomonospora endophytica TaxID=714109 RepID=A0A841G1S6_9ACTN|nr:cytochrome P450 [Phytomonospora endophytica]MBB6039712.1 cytochrome P450 [Phytomonospora endophytica]GIG70952.1 cytochrome P450 [Phytomonospora endophytica]